MQRFVVVRPHSEDALPAVKEGQPCKLTTTGKSLRQGDCVLFTVQGSNRWRGYGVVVSPPSSASESAAAESAAAESAASVWFRWSAYCPRDATATRKDKLIPGLGFASTLHLVDASTSLPINQAKNYQEIDAASGRALCLLLDKHVQALAAAASAPTAEHKGEVVASSASTVAPAAAAAAAAFFEHESTDHDVVGPLLMKRVAALGGFAFHASFVGSRRYNLQGAASDLDYLVVFAAETATVLSVFPPPALLTNPSNASPDVTVLELAVFCKMLLQGDPRVVESLFVDNAFVSSDEWKALCSRRDEFLTLAVVRKYLSDAEGPQKLQLLRKRHAERTRESERHHKGRNGTSAGSVVVDSSRGSGASAPTEWTQRQKQRQRTELLGDSSSAAVSLGTGGSDSKSAEAASSPASSLMMELMDAKDAKLWYLVFRLLFHALDVVQLRTIRVWFAERPRGEPADSKAEVKEHSADEQYARRDLLLSIRAGNRTHEELDQLAEQHLATLRAALQTPRSAVASASAAAASDASSESKAAAPAASTSAGRALLPDQPSADTHRFVHEWLMAIRKRLFA